MLLLFMKISLPTNQVFINIPLVHNLVVTLLRSLDGVLRMELNIGLSLTHGIKDGGIMVPSNSSEVQIT